MTPDIRFTNQTFYSTIEESAATGTDVIRVTVDNRLSSSTSFSFVGGNDNGAFSISNSGEPLLEHRFFQIREWQYYYLVFLKKVA